MVEIIITTYGGDVRRVTFNTSLVETMEETDVDGLRVTIITMESSHEWIVTDPSYAELTEALRHGDSDHFTDFGVGNGLAH
jgi:hypothetical protein